MVDSADAINIASTSVLSQTDLHQAVKKESADILKKKEKKNASTPLSKRMTFEELIEGLSPGKLKIFMEQAKKKSSKIQGGPGVRKKKKITPGSAIRREIQNLDLTPIGWTNTVDIDQSNKDLHRKLFTKEEISPQQEPKIFRYCTITALSLSIVGIYTALALFEYYNFNYLIATGIFIASMLTCFCIMKMSGNEVIEKRNDDFSEEEKVTSCLISSVTLECFNLYSPQQAIGQ